MLILLGMKGITTAGALDRELIPEVRRDVRKNALIGRVEVIMRGARRRWSVAEKRSIVLASLEPGVVVSAICRRHEISRGQLSTWRQMFREGALGGEYPSGEDRGLIAARRSQIAGGGDQAACATGLWFCGAIQFQGINSSIRFTGPDHLIASFSAKFSNFQFCH